MRYSIIVDIGIYKGGMIYEKTKSKPLQKSQYYNTNLIRFMGGV